MPRSARSAPAAAPISPGNYLRLRREAARLSIGAAARELALLAFKPIGSADVQKLQARIAELEADSAYLHPPQAILMRRVFAFDPSVYEQLFTLRHAGAATGAEWGLPVPQLCRSCGCSWHDACVTYSGQPCAWSTDPALCTACAFLAEAKPPVLHLVEGKPPVLHLVEGTPA